MKLAKLLEALKQCLLEEVFSALTITVQLEKKSVNDLSEKAGFDSPFFLMLNLGETLIDFRKCITQANHL